MNREWVLVNLCEAAEELSRPISEIETTPDYRAGNDPVVRRKPLLTGSVLIQDVCCCRIDV